MFKVIKKSSSNDSINLAKVSETGTALDKGKWYQLAENVKKFAGNFPVGSIVTATLSKKGEAEVVSYLAKLDSGKPSQNKDVLPVLGEEHNVNYTQQKSDRVPYEVEQQRKNKLGVVASTIGFLGTLGYTKKDSPEEISQMFNILLDKFTEKLDDEMKDIVKSPKVEISQPISKPLTKQESLKKADELPPIEDSIDDISFEDNEESEILVIE